MTTLSTHDTKRQEDVRARLAVLAEWPESWAHEVAEWHGLARLAHRRRGGQATERPPEPDLSTCCGRRWSAPGRSARNACAAT